VAHVGSDVSIRVINPLLDLGAVGVDGTATGRGDERVVAGIAHRDVMGNGLGIAARKPSRGFIALGQIERFQNLHDLLVNLHQAPSWVGCIDTAESSPGGCSFGVNREI
jgi:hypothetical protein